MAAEYGSLNYTDLVTATSAAAGTEIPTTWNWYDTFGVMVAGSWLFAYSYCITFIAGEVKRPDKSIILSNLFAIILPAVVMILVAVGLYRLVDFNFLSATAWVDQNGLEGYTMPWSPHFVGLAAIVMHNKVLLFLMAFSFLLFTVWWLALSYLAFPRILFAWGMDRMGPKWFTSVNARFASPVKNYILGFFLAEILIALYTFYLPFQEQGLSVTALEIFSVFGVTAIAALGLPLLEAGEGHLGVFSLSQVEDPGRAGCDSGGDRQSGVPGDSRRVLLLPGHETGGLHPADRHGDTGDVGAGYRLVLLLDLEGQEDHGHRHRRAHRRVAARVKSGFAI